MKKLSILFLLSVLFIGCSDDDDNENKSDFMVIETSLNGTWKAVSDKNGPIGVPFDRNSEDNTCPNKPDTMDVTNELLVAFIDNDFYNKIDDTQLGLYAYDTPLFENSIINCDPSGMNFLEEENGNSFIRNSIDAFQIEVTSNTTSNKISILTLKNNVTVEVSFVDEDNFEISTLRESGKEFFGKFTKISNDVNVEEFSKYFVTE